MSIQEVSPELLAELFHHYHQALAPDFHCASGPNAEPWEEIPQQEKGRMVAAARLALLELAGTCQAPADPRKYSAKPYFAKPYFAKPGEAEWGA
jgi:hypothetical protein